MKRRVITVPMIQDRKNKEKIVMLTAYDYLFARILDSCGVDMILVGDSVGTSYLGLKSTLPVSQNDILHHLKAVSRGVEYALIVGDMPFGSFQVSQTEAKQHAVEFIKAGAHAVKIEGAYHTDLIRELTETGIPVMGHLGLTPQSINTFGGYKVQGKDIDGSRKMVEDAKKLEASGVFSIVIEGVPSELARSITESISVPTIGIGAGSHCDGQVLVITDLLGLDPLFKPRFVKQYANLTDIVSSAVNNFKTDVQLGNFPEKHHTYDEDR